MFIRLSANKAPLKRTGFTLLELMIAAAILSIVIMGVYKAFSGGQKLANVEMKNQVVNDEVHRLVVELLDDIRSANSVHPDRPGTLPPGVSFTSYDRLDARDLANPKNDANTLVLTKFKMDPTTNPPKFKKIVATYTVEVDGTLPPASGTLFIMKEVAEFNDQNVLVAQAPKVEIAKNLDIFNFYRTFQGGPQNVFFRVICSRVEKENPTGPKYTAKMVCSGKLRSSSPRA